jgi:hypothetical protein
VKHTNRYTQAEANGENGQAIESCQAHEVVPPSLLFAGTSSDKCAAPTIALKG